MRTVMTTFVIILVLPLFSAASTAATPARIFLQQDCGYPVFSFLPPNPAVQTKEFSCTFFNPMDKNATIIHCLNPLHRLSGSETTDVPANENKTVQFNVTRSRYDDADASLPNKFEICAGVSHLDGVAVETVWTNGATYQTVSERFTDFSLSTSTDKIINMNQGEHLLGTYKFRNEGNYNYEIMKFEVEVDGPDDGLHVLSSSGNYEDVNIRLNETQEFNFHLFATDSNLFTAKKYNVTVKAYPLVYNESLYDLMPQHVLTYEVTIDPAYLSKGYFWGEVIPISSLISVIALAVIFSLFRRVPSKDGSARFEEEE